MLGQESGRNESVETRPLHPLHSGTESV
jgi:hypothetical protein